MEDASYTIKEKIFKGLEVYGFMIENIDTKEVKPIKMSDTVKLARNNKITNAKAILDTYKGQYILSIENGLAGIENSDRTNGIHLTLLARLIKDKKCIGYKVIDDKGKTYKLSSEKIWELSEQGSVKGIQGKIIGNHKCIVSTDTLSLKDIPKMFN